MEQAVTIDRELLGGTPCFSGTRVPVKSLFDHLELGYTVEGFLAEFPGVRKWQAIAVLRDSAAHVAEHVAAGTSR